MADFTISDIASELGVSKSTVSRVINGKGRISENTRYRVQKWIKDHGYTPNPMARALAQNKTNNIAVVIPRDADKGDIPFFQKCLVGISETVAVFGYDTILAIEDSIDISILERLVRNHKVDGVILTRLNEDDETVKFLQREKFPFVAIGTVKDNSICQVDSDQYSGCCEMTKSLIRKGYSRLFLIAGNKEHLVNQKRYQGFKKAYEECGLDVSEVCVMWNMEKSENVLSCLPDIMKTNPQCLVCMDDAICTTVLMWLSLNDYQVPEDVQIVSLYDSPVMEHNVPSITALSVNVAAMSRIAGTILIDKLEGKSVPLYNKVGYQLKIRKSSR